MPPADERFGKSGLHALADWHSRQTPHAFNRLASYEKAMDLLFGQLRGARADDIPTAGEP